MSRRITRRRRNVSLPTPVHYTLRDTISLGSSLGDTFTKGLIVFTTSFKDVDDGETTAQIQVPRSLTVGNVRMSIILDAAASFIANVSNLEVALMKIPQDYYTSRSAYQYTIPNEFAMNHPEWILCSKYIGKPSDSSVGQQYQPVRISGGSRRVKLLRGDQLALVVRGNLAGVQGALAVSGTIDCRTRLD